MARAHARVARGSRCMQARAQRGEGRVHGGTRARRALVWGAALSLALASCGGGGGGGGAKVAISFAGVGTTIAEGAPALSIDVVLHTSLAMLSEDATITVFDRGTGTASSGADYTAFAPALVTFPAGSIDGTVAQVTLTALNDLSVEGAAESVRLGLMSPTAAAIANPATYSATITDIHQATLRFALGASSAPNETDALRSVAVELDLAPGVSLGRNVSATVTDAGGGSASAGNDYAAIGSQPVQFSSGAVDGAMATVAVHVLADVAVEADEIVRLALGSPSAGAQIGATSLHQLTIPDDDTPGNSALLVSEGPSGIENALADDDPLDLGSQTVGAGANAGTLVRLTNAGASALSLSAPRLTGSHPNDFAIQVESASFPIAGASLAAPVAAELLPSPIVARANSSGPGQQAQLDVDLLSALQGLAPGHSAVLHGFPLPEWGAVTLEVQRQALPFADDAKLAIDGQLVDGTPADWVGDLSLWTGRVLELPESRVFLALSSTSTRGFLELPGAAERYVHIGGDGSGSPGSLRVVRSVGLAALGADEPSFFCAEPPPIEGLAGVGMPPIGALPVDPGQFDVAECRLAIETDFQLYQKFNSAPALIDYVTQLVAAVSSQYLEDVQTVLSIAYLGVYTNAGDPWTSQDSGGNASALLNEFVAAWAPNHWPAAANLAHFISGANLGGGVAYVNTLCNQSFGFGVSGNISGNIDWNGWSGVPSHLTWDFVVVAHELGHNFGSNHTHSYCPPLDRCSTNCTGSTSCTQGTIMSYCHTCGGMDNIDLEFHPVTANIMRQAVNSSCLGQSALLGGEHVQYRLTFNPLTTTGARSATLEFQHDAPNQPQPFRLLLSGTGN